MSSASRAAASLSGPGAVAVFAACVETSTMARLPARPDQLKLAEAFESGHPAARTPDRLDGHQGVTHRPEDHPARAAASLAVGALRDLADAEVDVAVLGVAHGGRRDLLGGGQREAAGEVGEDDEPAALVGDRVAVSGRVREARQEPVGFEEDRERRDTEHERHSDGLPAPLSERAVGDRLADAHEDEDDASEEDERDERAPPREPPPEHVERGARESVRAVAPDDLLAGLERLDEEVVGVGAAFTRGS